PARRRRVPPPPRGGDVRRLVAAQAGRGRPGARRSGPGPRGHRRHRRLARRGRPGGHERAVGVGPPHGGRRRGGGAMTAVRGRPVEAVLAAVATLVAGWPLAGLVESEPWVVPTVVVLVVVLVSGVLARALRAAGWAVVLLQVVLAALTLVWTHVPGSVRYGLPTRDTVTEITALWVEGMETIQT